MTTLFVLISLLTVCYLTDPIVSGATFSSEQLSVIYNSLDQISKIVDQLKSDLPNVQGKRVENIEQEPLNQVKEVQDEHKIEVESNEEPAQESVDQELTSPETSLKKIKKVRQVEPFVHSDKIVSDYEFGLKGIKSKLKPINEVKKYYLVITLINI